MLAEFLNRLLELKQDPVTHVSGIDYWTKSGKEIIPPRLVPLEFCSLTGMVDYFKFNLDAFVGEDPTVDLAIHVASHHEVRLIETDSQYEDRPMLARSTMPLATPDFGRWMDQEAFSIYLQTAFVITPERDALLATVATLEAEDVQLSKDDGVTQTVSARKGIVIRERKTMPSGIKLRPYRTFREVEQPESLFVLRVRGQKDGMELALFVADGDAWTLTAMRSIKDYLVAALEKTPVTILA